MVVRTLNNYQQDLPSLPSIFLILVFHYSSNIFTLKTYRNQRRTKRMDQDLQGLIQVLKSIVQLAQKYNCDLTLIL